MAFLDEIGLKEVASLISQKYAKKSNDTLSTMTLKNGTYIIPSNSVVSNKNAANSTNTTLVSGTPLNSERSDMLIVNDADGRRVGTIRASVKKDVIGIGIGANSYATDNTWHENFMYMWVPANKNASRAYVTFTDRTAFRNGLGIYTTNENPPTFVNGDVRVAF